LVWFWFSEEDDSEEESISAERTGMVDKINKNKSSSDLSERRKTDLQGSGAASGDFWTENLLKWIRRNLPK